MNIHHIGYLVKSIRTAAPEFLDFGYRPEGAGGGIIYDPIRRVDILFLTNGAYRIELVEPKDAESVVAGMLRKRGSSPYHICYECSDMEQVCKRLRENGYVPVGAAEPAAALDGRKVCFLYKRQTGLIELLEVCGP